MAVNVKAGVAAPLGPTSADLAAEFSQSLGYQPKAAEDPRETVQRLVGAVPQTMVPSPDVQRGMPLLQSPATIETMQDVADYSGSPYVAQQMGEPVLDEAGNVQYDPRTGDIMRRTIQPEDFNTQLAIEKAGVSGIGDAARMIAADPYANAQEGLRKLHEEYGESQFDANARIQDKLNAEGKTLDNYIEKTGNVLADVTKKAHSTLFSQEDGVLARGPDGLNIPVGTAVLIDNNALNKDTADALAIMGGVALSQATSQLGNKGRDYKAPVAEDGSAIPGADYMGSTIEAVTHFLNNGVKNLGLNLKPGSTDTLAKGLVFDAVNSGMLYAFEDTSGRKVLVADPDYKTATLSLQRSSEIFVGDKTRGRSSITPAFSGAKFGRNGPILTKGSITGREIITTAATATKNILGSVALVFRKKDVARKTVEMDQIFAEGNVVRLNNMFAYSTHPFAKRNGVSETDFLAAQVGAQVDASYDLNNPAHVSAYKEVQMAQALNVMQQKQEQMAYDLRNMQESTGIRYSEWMHGLNNQRFYPASFDTDYMGSKNVIRDVMGLANQEVVQPHFMFDEAEVKRLKDIGSRIFSMAGEDVDKALNRLSTAERGAIGAMYSAVIHYHSTLNNDIPNIEKVPMAKAMQYYTPAIANKLAELGAKYSAYVSKPTPEMDPELFRIWAAMEKGEAMGTLNLYDDFNMMQMASKDPVRKKIGVPLTHHVFDDGNQNGIFLQALFFGQEGPTGSDALVRLGTANPNLADQRVFGMGVMLEQLERNLSDTPEHQNAWRSFWKAAMDKRGRDTVAKDFFKKPLMQNAYGKDAAMFAPVLRDLLEVDQDYSNLVQEHLLPVMGINDAVDGLNGALETTLRQIVDSKSVNMLKNIGRFMSVIDAPLFVPDVTGDTSVFTPVEVSLVNKTVPTAEYVKQEMGNGQTAILKYRGKTGDVLTDPSTGNEVTLPDYQQQLKPSATKGTQPILNRRTMKYDEFHNPLGTKQARQLSVLPIQAIDGSLVKWTTLRANEGRSTPAPVLWVHDSLISTPGASLIYRNIYNNIAIPGAIPHIAQFGKTIKSIVENATRKEIDAVERRGVPVGIGTDGEYPAMGALFDDYQSRIDVNNTEYRDKVFLPRVRAQNKTAPAPRDARKHFQQVVSGSRKTPEQKWNEYVHKVQGILDRAQQYGWVPESYMPPGQRKAMAVTPAGFRGLVGVAGEVLRMKGPENTFDKWASDFERRTNNAGKTLKAAAGNNIWQMSPSGGNAPKEVSQPKPKAIAADIFDDLPEIPKPSKKPPFNPGGKAPF